MELEKRPAGGEDFFICILVSASKKLLECSGASVKIYHALAHFADFHTGRCWPSYSRLMKETGLSRETVAIALSELQSKELIERSRGFGRVNRYQVRGLKLVGKTRPEKPTSRNSRTQSSRISRPQTGRNLRTENDHQELPPENDQAAETRARAWAGLPEAVKASIDAEILPELLKAYAPGREARRAYLRGVRAEEFLLQRTLNAEARNGT